MFFEALISLLVAAHLLAMNVASAGPLVAAALRSTRRGDQVENCQAGRRMASLSLGAMFAGAALGGLALALPSPGMREALSRFPGRAYWFAGTELLFSAGCIAAIAVGWSRLGKGLTWMLALVSASNLLYHFPPLMAVFGLLASDPSWASETTIDRPTLLRLMGRENVISLSVHFALASWAVTAAVLLWSPRRRHPEQPEQPEQPNADRATPEFLSRAARWALWPTLFQLPVGAWVLITTGGRAREAMLGGDLWATASLGGGIVAALFLIQTLAGIALGDVGPSARLRAIWLLALVVALMTFTLRHSRPRPFGIAASSSAASSHPGVMSPQGSEPQRERLLAARPKKKPPRVVVATASMGIFSEPIPWGAAQRVGASARAPD